MGLKWLSKFFIFFLLLYCVSCNQFYTVDQQIQRTGLPIFYLYPESEVPYEHKIPTYYRYKFKKKTLEGHGKVRRRGGISAVYNKRSYTLKTKQTTQFLDFAPDREWILNASYIDKTFMRHKLCYDLFRQFNPENVSPKSTYAHVYLEETYLGLYVLMERLNQKRLDIVTQDSQVIIYKDPPIFTTPERLSVYELEPNDPWFQKFPKKPSVKFNKEMDVFRDFLLNANDETFWNQTTGIESKINLEQVIDWQLLLLLSNNGDGLVKNFYMFRRQANEPFQLAIWDCDHTFGRDGDGELSFFKRIVDPNKNILFKRLLKNPDYVKKLHARWVNLRTQNIVSTENIFKMIAVMDKEIKSSLPFNAAIHPYDGQYYYDDNNYEQEIEILKTFIEKRIPQLDEQMGYDSGNEK